MTTTSDPARPGELDAAMEALARLDLGTQSLSATLQLVAELAKRALPEVDETSITLLRGERAHTAVFTSPIAVRLDERQYESGFGPCLDCAATGATILLRHTDPDPVYPAFTREALRAGIRHTVSVALLVPHRSAGALNLYAADTEISVDTVLAAERFAAYAAVAVANADRLDHAQELAAQMQQAMQSRAVIEQAKGILMARHGYDADRAFAELARRSQHKNVKLRDLAARMVADPRRAG